MSLPIVAIRPQPGCATTVAAGVQAGLAVQPWPLFAVQPRPWSAPDPGGIDALLIGSANALRHAGPGLDAFRDKPAHVVGQATAAAARAAGLVVASVGSGGLQAVLDTVPAGTVLLRLAGEEHVPLACAPGTEIVTRVAYASVALPMAVGLASILRQGALVLLHSAAAATHFSAECDRLGLPRAGIRLAALGPRIAAAAGQGWGAVGHAALPSDAALLALARELCH